MSETNTHGDAPITDELGYRLFQVNLELAEFGGDESVSPQRREELQEQLDVLWEYGVAECAFSGLCQIVESTAQGTTVKHDFVDGGVGECDGFWIIKFGTLEHQYWTTALGFHQDNISDLGAENRRVDYFLHIGALYGVVPVAEIDDAFPEGLGFMDTVHEVLSAHSDELASLLRAPEFLKLNCEEQKYFIDSSIQEIKDACAKRKGTVEGRAIGLNGERAYVLRQIDTRVQYEEVDIAGEDVKGVCSGLTVLARRQLAQGSAIKNREELVDTEAGICLAVQVAAGPMGLQEGEEIYIPISGQQLEATFDVAAIQQM